MPGPTPKTLQQIIDGLMKEAVKENQDCLAIRGKFTKGLGYTKSWYNRFQEYNHRLSFLYHNGDIPKGMQVLHTCDNPACINPAHLFLGTITDNMRDKVNKGRQLKGAAHGNSVLTEEKVKRIKQNPQISGTALAKEFGVNANTIYAVRKGRSWEHIN